MENSKAAIKRIETKRSVASSIRTRSQSVLKNDVQSKRKAESPLKAKLFKRTALNDVNYQENGKEAENLKSGVVIKALGLKNSCNIVSKTTLTSLAKKTTTTTAKPSGLIPRAQNQITRGEAKPTKPDDSKIPVTKAKSLTKTKKETEVQNENKSPVHKGPVTRRSLSRRISSASSGDSSLYLTALEDLNLEDKDKSSCGLKDKRLTKKIVDRGPPPGVYDFDSDQLGDVSSVSTYAHSVFKYLKTREDKFKVKDYLHVQKAVTPHIRAQVVDWLVEFQEYFEFNHETLYLAVKLFDLFVSKVIVQKKQLQTIACACIYVASKFDERLPPAIDNILHMADNDFTADDLCLMEVKVLQKIDYDLGAPLSYTFLRRYARVAMVDLPLLTLARYILEMSLMEYATVLLSESKLAAAALYLALSMNKKAPAEWTPTLQYYSGYTLDDLKQIILILNSVLHKTWSQQLSNIKNKYSHKAFFKVALSPLLTDSELNL